MSRLSDGFGMLSSGLIRGDRGPGTSSRDASRRQKCKVGTYEAVIYVCERARIAVLSMLTIRRLTVLPESDN
jgi:hypothetical protein